MQKLNIKDALTEQMTESVVDTVLEVDNEVKEASDKPVKTKPVKTIKVEMTKKPAVTKSCTTTAKRSRTKAASTEIAKNIDLTDPSLYLNREINWIDFDRKVLEQSMDASVPLLERLKFLSIFYNNLDEFFMVRVANVWKQVQSGAEPTGADKTAPRRQLSEIGRRVRQLCDEAEEHWKIRLLPAIRIQG